MPKAKLTPAFVRRDPHLRVGDNWATRAGRRAHVELRERVAQKPGWPSEPAAPTSNGGPVRKHGVTWFDRVQSLEDQATHWYFRTATAQPWRKPNLTALAVTLYRLGQVEEALALFDAPVPKTAIATLVTEGRCVQRWLKEQVGEA